MTCVRQARLTRTYPLRGRRLEGASFGDIANVPVDDDQEVVGCGCVRVQGDPRTVFKDPRTCLMTVLLLGPLIELDRVGAGWTHAFSYWALCDSNHSSRTFLIRPHYPLAFDIRAERPCGWGRRRRCGFCRTMSARDDREDSLVHHSAVGAVVFDSRERSCQ